MVLDRSVDLSLGCATFLLPTIIYALNKQAHSLSSGLQSSLSHLKPFGATQEVTHTPLNFLHFSSCLSHRFIGILHEQSSPLQRFFKHNVSLPGTQSLTHFPPLFLHFLLCLQGTGSTIVISQAQSSDDGHKSFAHFTEPGISTQSFVHSPPSAIVGKGDKKQKF